MTLYDVARHLGLKMNSAALAALVRSKMGTVTILFGTAFALDRRREVAGHRVGRRERARGYGYVGAASKATTRVMKSARRVSPHISSVFQTATLRASLAPCRIKALVNGTDFARKQEQEDRV